MSDSASNAWVWDIPSYVRPPRVPADNPMSEAKYQLGRHLFYDKRLSDNATISCASCHVQSRAFTNGHPTAIGSTGEHTPRNVPSVANAAWHATLTWADPAIVTLETQMDIPMFGEHPVEMGVTDASKPQILSRLESDPYYPQAFKEAFPDRKEPMSFEIIIKAIACFERGILSFDSKYDRNLQGKATLNETEQRGRDLFFGEKGGCHHCHRSSNFDGQFVNNKGRVPDLPFHNTGLYNIDGKGAYPVPNRGLFESTGNPEDMGKFRVPSLRNVAVTGPYMHDGSVATLEDVVEIYSQGGRKIDAGPYAGDGRISPVKSGLIVKIDLTAEEKADIVAFLKTLTDESLMTSDRFSDPWNSPASSTSPQRSDNGKP
ncbi:MAG TPA: di-heme enzyme [Methylocella sp.]|nr:di-heme enzyme [Methylocella sp.]